VLPALAGTPPRDFSKVLTRRAFEEMIEPFIERIRSICEEALNEALLTPEKIDQVVLMGGQANTPRVMAAVESVFGKASVRGVDLAAAGAAMQVGILTGLVKDLVLLDAWLHALGIDWYGKLVQIVPPRRYPRNKASGSTSPSMTRRGSQ
jgi:molecular chaperone DnaK